MSPWEKGNHPELETSKYLCQDGIQKHKYLIGAIKWDVSLGRLDVNATVMTLASFRAKPREGNVDRARRVVSYLVKFKHATIRIGTEEPDLSSMPITPYEREESVCGKVSEIIYQDTPAPKGKYATTLIYLGSNLCHNVLTERSVTGVIHFLNKTLVDWHSKKKSVVETAICDSKYCSARACVKKILDLEVILRYLGVPIQSLSYVFGNKKVLWIVAWPPNGKTHKRHISMSFHRIRESLADGIVNYQFIYEKVTQWMYWINIEHIVTYVLPSSPSYFG